MPEGFGAPPTPPSGTGNPLAATGGPHYALAVASACPSCRAPLVEGALRCKLCGADARRAEDGPVGASFTLAGIAPRAARAAELLDELAGLAPEVLAWWRRADRPRRVRLYEILTELRELLRPPRSG
jgi:hypothetical protein